jgi:hypothetical protein
MKKPENTGFGATQGTPRLIVGQGTPDPPRPGGAALPKTFGI